MTERTNPPLTMEEAISLADQCRYQEGGLAVNAAMSTFPITLWPQLPSFLRTYAYSFPDGSFILPRKLDNPHDDHPNSPYFEVITVRVEEWYEPPPSTDQSDHDVNVKWLGYLLKKSGERDKRQGYQQMYFNPGADDAFYLLHKLALSTLALDAAVRSPHDLSYIPERNY